MDIGGTLAKIAYYVPKNDPKFTSDPEYHQKLTHQAIPCKTLSLLTLSPYLSRTIQWRHNLSAVFALLEDW